MHKLMQALIGADLVGRAHRRVHRRRLGRRSPAARRHADAGRRRKSRQQGRQHSCLHRRVDHRARGLRRVQGRAARPLRPREAAVLDRPEERRPVRRPAHRGDQGVDQGPCRLSHRRLPDAPQRALPEGRQENRVKMATKAKLTDGGRPVIGRGRRHPLPDSEERRRSDVQPRCISPGTRFSLPKFCGVSPSTARARPRSAVRGSTAGSDYPYYEENRRHQRDLRCPRVDYTGPSAHRTVRGAAVRPRLRFQQEPARLAVPAGPAPRAPRARRRLRRAEPGHGRHGAPMTTSTCSTARSSASTGSWWARRRCTCPTTPIASSMRQDQSEGPDSRRT